MIEVEHLTKRYGEFVAVNDVSFRVGEGEIVGFLGPNGAGKTTTMRILTCFLPATSGTAKVAGFDCFTQGLEVRRRIGYLPENVPLYGEMRTREYLNFRAKLKDVPRSARRNRVEDVIEKCGLRSVENQVIGTLSKGYRQRVGIADCLVHDPKIMILDEPEVGLDPIQIREIRALIKELGKTRTILLSTHILPEVEMVCERFIIVNRGRVVKDADMSSLRQRSTLLVQCTAPPAALKEVLQGVEGVKDVKVSDSEGVSTATVDSRGKDIRKDVVALLAAKGWELREMSSRSQTLEEMFVEATTQEESK